MKNLQLLLEIAGIVLLDVVTNYFVTLKNEYIKYVVHSLSLIYHLIKLECIIASEFKKGVKNTVTVLAMGSVSHKKFLVLMVSRKECKKKTLCCLCVVCERI